MKRPFCFLFLLIILGIALFYPRSYEPDATFPQGMTYPVEVTGQLTALSRQTNSLSLTLSSCQIQYEGQPYSCQKLLVTLAADTLYDPLMLGNHLSVAGSLSSFQPARNPGNFDWREYYLSRHISYRIYADQVTVTDPQVHRLAHAMTILRETWAQRLLDLCPEDHTTSAVLQAMLLGDKTWLEEEIQTKYEQSGLLHLLTVSGLHIGLLGTAVLTLATACSLPPWLRSLLSGTTVFLYGQLCGGGISSTRAILMFLCLLAAPLLERSYDSLSSLSLAGTLLLIYSPRLLFQAGFQLSFGAILGIQLVCPCFVSLWNRTSPSAGTPHLARIGSSFLFGLGLQLTLLPITLYHFFRYPLYSLLLNLLALPLASPLFLLAVSALLLSGLPSPAFLFLSRLLLLPCQWILTLYNWCCTTALKLPAASSLLGRPSPVRIFLYYGGLLLFCLWCHRQKITDAKAANPRESASRPSSKKLLRLFVIMVCNLMILLYPLPASGLTVVFVDVGQGDCAFMRTPTGTTLLIDCGSSDVQDLADHRLTPFLESQAVRHLDYVFLSHTDEDHTNGVLAWLEAGGSIGTVILPHLPDTLTETSAHQSLLTRLKNCQVPVCYLSQGDVWQEDALTLTCLAPSADPLLLSRYPDTNSASQVILAQFQGIRILFTGDCEKEGEQHLLSYLKEQQIICDILKAGHHGSGNATGSALLAQLDPQILVISCGVRNRYGHPHPAVLERAEQQGITCYTTASCGAVTITIRQGTAHLTTHLPPGSLYYR